MKRSHAPSHVVKESVADSRRQKAQKPRCLSLYVSFALKRFFAPLFASACMLKVIEKLEETFAADHAVFEIARARRDA